MKTHCLRRGCPTGPNHSGVQLHGFLSYLVKTQLAGEKYRVFGYKGKQDRDSIHSLDVARMVDTIYQAPRVGEVYNVGGGHGNSCSLLEAFKLVDSLSGKSMRHEIVPKARRGDHVCYISKLAQARNHFPAWDVTRSLEDTVRELITAWDRRLSAA